MCVCVCVCECVSLCVCVSVRACMCVRLFQPICSVGKVKVIPIVWGRKGVLFRDVILILKLNKLRRLGLKKEGSLAVLMSCTW